MKKHLKRFAAMDSNKDGLVCEEDMAGFLQVPIDPSFHSFFSSFKQVCHECVLVDCDGLEVCFCEFMKAIEKCLEKYNLTGNW